ncbi:unnamed protein product [Brachionus calyciflorus]|uniref:Uncharacterized protein n=1 Tax=Brachionus calyciflorus TaxID=104777 RepID=A0A814IMM9_9BILA|nr:unnamed protein product [Brachionus calyciflorus]
MDQIDMRLDLESYSKLSNLFEKKFEEIFESGEKNILNQVIEKHLEQITLQMDNQNKKLFDMINEYQNELTDKLKLARTDIFNEIIKLENKTKDKKNLFLKELEKLKPLNDKKDLTKKKEEILQQRFIEKDRNKNEIKDNIKTIEAKKVNKYKDRGGNLSMLENALPSNQSGESLSDTKTEISKHKILLKILCTFINI